jgi:hypothetical protein
MNAGLLKSIVLGSLMLVAFAASGCGTLEIEQEPATGAVEAAATPTALPPLTAAEMSSPSPKPLPSPTATRVAQDEELIWDSEISALDDTWNLYTSKGQGFSIKFPKTMATFRGACTWNAEQGSYRPQTAIVPVKVFEDSDAVYIASEHYFELAEERIEDNRAYYDACNQITNSLELLRDPDRFQEPFWKLVVREVHDDAELDGFLKDRYGSGCSVGDKEPTGQDGVYRVRIQGDGKAMEETQCLLNYRTVVMYYPAGQKVVAWDTGQAPTFPADVDYSVIHDQEMVDSFRFVGAAADAESLAPPEPAAPLASYRNTEYGFSFEYPSSWMVAEVNDEAHVGPGSRSVQLSQGSVKLVIGYRRAGEQTPIVASGLPAGEFVERGAVRMLGQDVPRHVLVFDGKDKGAYYNGWSVIRAGDLEFALSLHDFDPDYGQVELSQNVQDEADVILGTLALLERASGAVEPTPVASESPPASELTSYTDDDFGFTFEYPADWFAIRLPRSPP